MVGGLLLRGVEYGAFAVQFLRWWESRGVVAGAALPPPPPPQVVLPNLHFDLSMRQVDVRSQKYLFRNPTILLRETFVSKFISTIVLRLKRLENGERLNRSSFASSFAEGRARRAVEKQVPHMLANLEDTDSATGVGVSLRTILCFR